MIALAPRAISFIRALSNDPGGSKVMFVYMKLKPI